MYKTSILFESKIQKEDLISNFLNLIVNYSIVEKNFKFKFPIHIIYYYTFKFKEQSELSDILIKTALPQYTSLICKYIISLNYNTLIRLSYLIIKPNTIQSISLILINYRIRFFCITEPAEIIIKVISQRRRIADIRLFL